MTTERESFEAWGGDQGYPLRRIHDEADQPYLDLRTQGAWEAWQARAQLAQAVPLLSDEVIKAAALEAFDCTWDADDETLVNKYGHGVYLWRFVDFTRAIEQAVRAKMGVAVPMTPRDYAAALDSAIENDDIDGDVDMWTFIAGIKAAERHHGIVGKEGA